MSLGPARRVWTLPGSSPARMAWPALSLGCSGFPTGRSCPQGFLRGSLLPRPLAQAKPEVGATPTRLPPSAGPGSVCTRQLRPQPRTSPAGGAPARAAERPSVPSRAPETVALHPRPGRARDKHCQRHAHFVHKTVTARKEQRLRLGSTHYHFATQLRRSSPGSKSLQF